MDLCILFVHRLGAVRALHVGQGHRGSASGRAGGRTRQRERENNGPGTGETNSKNGRHRKQKQ